MTPNLLPLAALCTLTLAACALEPGLEEATGEARGAATSENGMSLNGRSLNGRSLNGRSLNGRSLNGRSLNGVSLGGLALDGGALRAPGRNLVGAELTGTLDDGSPLTLRIDAIEKSDDDPLVRFYTVSFAADGGFYPLCEDEAGRPTQAIPLPGRWDYGEGVPGGGDHIDDPDAFTFACRGYALAKCVELGYAPWETYRVGARKLSLRDHHQACTRAIRADYCGDGAPHTVDGTLIDIYDAIGVQADTTPWSLEAEWGPDGALCVARERLLGAAEPACWPALLVPGCGDPAHFASGSLIMTEDAL